MPIEQNIAGLRTILAGGPDRQGGGDGPLVCLFHGYGANGRDLAGLWRVLDVPQDTRFAFPEAPLSLAELFGFPAYAWWHIDVERFSSALSGGVALDALFDEEPPGLAESRAQILTWLSSLRQQLHDLPLNRVILGGFSQGAMLSVDVALHLRESIAGLCVLSGALINRKKWRERVPHAPSAPRFQSHGMEDPLLPFIVGESLHDFLQLRPYPGELYRFHGGHEISPGVLDQMGRHISAWLV